MRSLRPITFATAFAAALASPGPATAQDAWIYLRCEGRASSGDTTEQRYRFSARTWEIWDTDTIRWSDLCRVPAECTVESGRLVWMGSTGAIHSVNRHTGEYLMSYRQRYVGTCVRTAPPNEPAQQF